MPSAPDIQTIRKRADFLAAQRAGQRYGRPTVTVEAVRAAGGGEVETGRIRMGVTATRKLGGAVIRNRVKRRLRAAARELLPQYGRAGCDYVFIGRAPTRSCPFSQLRDDMREALQALGRRLDRDRMSAA